MKIYTVVINIVILSVFAIGCSAPETADLVLVNGKIVTVDEDQPEAQAVAIRGEQILAVGSDEEINALKGENTRTINLLGRTVIPGLIDGHLHFAGLGSDVSRIVELDDTRTIEEALALIKRRVDNLPAGEWLTGRGWHYENWGTDAWPTKEALDEVAPNNPVSFVGMHSHASWMNSKALELAGITRDSPDPSDGIIQRDTETGEPTGILIENAQRIVRAVIPAGQREPLTEQIKKSVALAHSFGFTGAHDMGTSVTTINAYRELIEAGEFDFRINGYIRIWETGEILDEFISAGPVIAEGNHRLTARGVKMSIDGALGARGAALLAPYSDEPGASGVIRVTPENVYGVLKACLENGFTAALHSIGDRGNRIVLDAVEKALAEIPVIDHRMRVEHSQIVALEDIPRFAELGLIASFQWMHATLDMPWAERRVGPDRIKGGYAWRTFLNEGVRIVGGSDEGRRRFSPFMGIHAAVTRQDSEGNPEGGWYPEQRLTRLEAVKSYTLDAAYMGFEEDVLGSITPGKFADLVILTKDIMTIPAEEILDTEADITIVSGKVVFERGK